MTNIQKAFIWAVAVLMFVMSSNILIGQDEKIEKAEAKFCESVTIFIESLNDLEAANLRMDITNFNDAYKNVDKAWNKLQKSAHKLEEVDTKEAEKAYNAMVETLEEVVISNVKSSVNTDKIAKQVVKSRETIKKLNSSVCQKL